ncbi:hypothetical protein BHE74_00023806 [Ensete ventricosum]|nr:hypothetical protein BHE74_00023806 [Ensete ventricosum]
MWARVKSGHWTGVRTMRWELTRRLAESLSKVSKACREFIGSSSKGSDACREFARSLPKVSEAYWEFIGSLPKFSPDPSKLADGMCRFGFRGRKQRKEDGRCWRECRGSPRQKEKEEAASGSRSRFHHAIVVTDPVASSMGVGEYRCRGRGYTATRSQESGWSTVA